MTFEPNIRPVEWTGPRPRSVQPSERGHAHACAARRLPSAPLKETPHG